MNLEDVANEMRAALTVIEGLRIPPWGVEQVTPPAAIVAAPETIEYDATKRRGFDRYPDFAVALLLARGNTQFTRADLAAYCDGAGPRSIKQALDTYAYTACDSVRVASADIQRMIFAGNPYDGVMFSVDVVGRGSTP